MGGRKKKKKRYVVFCYYCDRHFDNEKVLIEHQRGKHFKCPICHRRLSSARGMMIHVFQVHKESIDAVPHAKKGRDSFELEIFGMVGVPQELVQERLIKIYGEPAAKKQKIEHAPHQSSVMMPGGPPRPNVYNPQQNQPPPQMMGRGMPPPHPQFGMPPHGFMPPNRGMPPPHQMMPGPYGNQMPPNRGMGGPPNHPGMPPQHQNFIPPHHQMQNRHHQMQNPHHQMQNPQQHGMPQPGMMPPQIQQQPISNDAKIDVVERADQLVHQSSIVKKTTKKKIIRIYDRPGVSMEEMRALHPKYSTGVTGGPQMH